MATTALLVPPPSPYLHHPHVTPLSRHLHHPTTVPLLHYCMRAPLLHYACHLYRLHTALLPTTPTSRVPATALLLPSACHLRRATSIALVSLAPPRPHTLSPPQPRPTHSLLTCFISLSLPSTTHYLTSTLSYPSVRRLEHQPHAAPLVYSHSSSNSPRPPGRRGRGRAATDR